MAADTGDKLSMTIRFESPEERSEFLSEYADHDYRWVIGHGKEKRPITVIETHTVR